MTSLFNWDFLYSCTAVDNTSTDIARSLCIAERLVTFSNYIYVYEAVFFSYTSLLFNNYFTDNMIVMLTTSSGQRT